VLDSWEKIKLLVNKEAADMGETCPYCGKEFVNTKALGSHIHYMHDTKSPNSDYVQVERSEADQRRFRFLLENCLSGRGLRVPPRLEKIERALTEIPPGVSPALDRYRNGFACARSKEELLKDVEELLQQEEAE